jgi:hypothetical protein
MHTDFTLLHPDPHRTIRSLAAKHGFRDSSQFAALGLPRCSAEFAGAFTDASLSWSVLIPCRKRSRR